MICLPKRQVSGRFDAETGPTRLAAHSSHRRFGLSAECGQAGWGYPVSIEKPERSRGRMPSVLIVDDEDAIRGLIREALGQAGYQVREARDGKEGLLRYRQTPSDLVIMDILMPDQDGLESILTLRREFPAAKIIAITGGSDMIGILNFLDVAKMLGARRTLQKPFDMKHLIEAVERELAS